MKVSIASKILFLPTYPNNTLFISRSLLQRNDWATNWAIHWAQAPLLGETMAAIKQRPGRVAELLKASVKPVAVRGPHPEVKSSTPGVC